ncbi:MAG: polysaccharide deacetylase family protein [Promethearchaeota archaeon]
MIYWALLLHIYQPPFQKLEILQKINEECYSKLFDVFLRYPTKFTLNINGSLTELFHQYKFLETINKIKELAQKGKLRFTGSAMYHPILPFLPDSEIMRQINLNEDYNERVLGSSYAKPKGFFPPEMAISENILTIIEQLGYKWVIASGIACPNNRDWPIHSYYTYKSLPILFRDDIISNEISFKRFTPLEILSKIKTVFDNNYYIITAMDGETFGHHIKNYEEDFLGTIFEQLEGDEEEIQMIFIDDLLNLFKKEGEIVPINSSWSTTQKNLNNKNPYPLWNSLNNKIQEVQNYLRKIAIKLWNNLEKYSTQIPEDHQEFYNNARINLDKGENSDGTWWASSFNFNEDIIYRSTQFLVRSVVNAYKALFSIPLKHEEIILIRHLYEDFKGNYANLFQLIGNKTEDKSRFKAYRRRIDDLDALI